MCGLAQLCNSIDHGHTPHTALVICEASGRSTASTNTKYAQELLDELIIGCDPSPSPLEN
jgi:hypothetical protein